MPRKRYLSRLALLWAFRFVLNTSGVVELRRRAGQTGEAFSHRAGSRFSARRAPRRSFRTRSARTLLMPAHGLLAGSQARAEGVPTVPMFPRPCRAIGPRSATCIERTSGAASATPIPYPVPCSLTLAVCPAARFFRPRWVHREGQSVASALEARSLPRSLWTTGTGRASALHRVRRERPQRRRTPRGESEVMRHEGETFPRLTAKMV